MNKTGGNGGIKSFVITVAFIFLFTVALLLDVQYLYLMAVMVALIQPISYAMVALSSPRYQVTREHVSAAVEEQPLTITLRAVAQGSIPALMLELDEHVPAALRLVDTTASKALVDWDGHEGFRQIVVVPQLRGVHRLGPTSMNLSDPLGLFSFSAEVAAPTELVVHPAPIGGRISPSGAGGRVGVRERDGKIQRGAGMEFHGVRPYHPGDSLRRVHWPTSARTGNLAVVEFERAFEQDMVIGLDLRAQTHVGSGRESTLEYAIKIAATLADRTLAREGGVSLVTQAGSVVVKKGTSDPKVARFQLFDHLAYARDEHEQSLARALTTTTLPPNARYILISAAPDAELLRFLETGPRTGTPRLLYYLDPSTFGGPATMPPPLPSASVQVIQRKHSPWEEGGKRLEQILRRDS